MSEFKPIIWCEKTSQYFEFKPAQALYPYIDCYWVSMPQTAADTERVIPDLCADFIMTFRPDMTFKGLRYCGPSTRYFMSVSQSAEIFLGIRFYLSSLRSWLPSDLSQTKDRLIEEWDGFSEFAQFLSKEIEKEPSLHQLMSAFNQFFLKRLLQVNFPTSSPLIKNVISNCRELVDYREVIQREVISERSVQRLFRQETGLSPYEVYDILRFQKTLKRMVLMPKEPFVELALTNGYCDQAHFTRRFKVISGLTPTDIRQNCRNYPRQLDFNQLQ